MSRPAAVFLLIILGNLFLGAQDTLILYDGPPGRSEAFKTASYIQNLLGHFSLEQREIRSIRDITPETLKNRNFIFVVCEEGAPEFPDSFPRDLMESKAVIIWIHMFIERLLEESAGRFGIGYKEPLERDDWSISYKGEVFPKEDPLLQALEVTDPGIASIHATVRSPNGAVRPYVLHSRNLWIFADSPFSFAMESGRFLILADLLHDILGRDHPAVHRAMIRIEDVNPESNPASLKKITRYLMSQKIPFQISLIPFFVDPEEQMEVSLSERPDLAQVLRNTQEEGGTIVLHGVTHQHRGLTGDDFEFWNDITGVPIQDESHDWILRRVERGLTECFRNGLYPLSWETPHYSASKNDYRAFSRLFDTFYDRVMAAELSGTQQIFPYPARFPQYGVTVIPENLGYISGDSPDPEALIAAAGRMRVVRDGIASFFYHPFLPLSYLKQIISGMKRQGWAFISLRDFPANLRTESCWVTSQGGEGSVASANQYIYRRQQDRSGRILRETYSTTRSKGIITDHVSLQKGGLHILESRNLPPGEKKTLSQKVFSLFTRNREKPGSEEFLRTTQTLLFIDPLAEGDEKNDQESFRFVLSMLGFNPETRDIGKLSKILLHPYQLIVIPYASAKKYPMTKISSLQDWLSPGGVLILDGATPLSDALGISFRQNKIKIKEIKELTLPVPNPEWQDGVTLSPLVDTGNLPLVRDPDTGQVLAQVSEMEKGKILMLATLFDPDTKYGISRFPYFPHYLKNSLLLPFQVRRDNLEFYFDPGFHPQTSWEKLVKQWNSSGIRVIYLAAWHEYNQYRFDYEYFTHLCHQQGIAVYAWFEFPQVTPKLWESHPLWREKTATGKDGKCHWRLQMNLRNPSAREAARRYFREILLKYDWDGINLAELNFDTNRGAADPDHFTPMNEDVRNDFHSLSGVDPIELFQSGSINHWQRNPGLYSRFLEYRTQLTLELHRFFLKEAENIRKRKTKNLEVIVTAMDSLFHPEIVEECGIDTEDIIGLMNEFDFTLQVEDPARSWTSPPSRYLRYYERYRKKIPDPHRLMFDINCMPDRDIRGHPLPTPLPSGTELFATLFFATFPSGRAAIYSEKTVLPFDLDFLPFILGNDVEINRDRTGYSLQAKEPYTLSLRNGGPDSIPLLNGKEWPFHDSSGLYLPAGTHHLEFRRRTVFTPGNSTLKIIFDGPISAFDFQSGEYRLAYHSRLPVTLHSNRPLNAVYLDSHPTSASNGNTVWVFPRGSHELRIIPESISAQAINRMGFISSTVFYLFGTIAGLLLLILFLYIRIKR